jgi:hypothetical protein
VLCRVLLQGDVAFLTLEDRGYPKKLSLAFLQEVAKEYLGRYKADALPYIR